MAERAKRTIRPPSKYLGEEEDDFKGSQEGTKVVLRLLEQKDITKDLLDREVFLLWPDDDLWYPADVKKVELRIKRANVHYTTTDEKENINLNELVNERQIAFKEERKSGYRCKANEVDEPKFHSKAGGGDANDEDEAEDPAMSEDEEEAAADDPDVDSDASESNSDQPGSDDSAVDDDDEPLDFNSSRSAKMDPSSGGKRRLRRGDPPLHKRPRRTSDALTPIASRSSRQSGEEAVRSERTKRQVTLSAKAQELLAAERSGWGKAGEEVRKDSTSNAAERGAGGGEDDDEVKRAEEYERALFARLSKKPSISTKSFFGGRESEKHVTHSPTVARQKSNVSASGPSDEEVRAKAVTQLQAALQKSVDESAVKGLAEGLPNPEDVAQEVEKALFRLYGNAGKDYRHKFRSLVFNLKDDSNPELRSRVLHGDLPPDNLVHLSANELASKELSQWRRAKEEEAMKAAVLDVAAASKFSTAAAIASQQSMNSNRNVDWRDNTLATSSPPRVLPPAREPTPEPVEDVVNNLPEDTTTVEADVSLAPPEPIEPSKSVEQAATGTEASTASHQGVSPAKELADWSGSGTHSTAVGGRATSLGGPPSTASASFDWANIKAQALKEGKDVKPLFDSAIEEDTKSPVSPKKEQRKHHAQEAQQWEQPTSPPGPADSDAAYHPGEELREGYAIARSTGQPGQIWEGYLGNTGFDNIHAAIDYLAGNPHFASALPMEEEVAVKGRTPLDKLAAFMHNLRNSRSRTASLGLLRLARDSSEDQATQLQQLIDHYLEKERSGIIINPGRYELYLVPPCPLAADLFAAARQSGADVEEIPDGQLLVISIHAKELEAPPKRSHSSERRHRDQHHSVKAEDHRAGNREAAQPHQGAIKSEDGRDPHARDAERNGTMDPRQDPRASAASEVSGATTQPQPAAAGSDPRAQTAQVEPAAGDSKQAFEHSSGSAERHSLPAQGGSASMDLKLLEGVDLSSLSSLAALLGAGAVSAPDGPMQQPQDAASQPQFSGPPASYPVQQPYSQAQPSYSSAPHASSSAPQTSQPWGLPGPPPQQGLLGPGPSGHQQQQLPTPHGYQQQQHHNRQPQQYAGAYGQYPGPPRPGPVTLPPPPAYAPQGGQQQQQPQYAPHSSGLQPFPHRPITLPPPAQQAPITLQPPRGHHASSRGHVYNHGRGRGRDSGRGRS